MTVRVRLLPLGLRLAVPAAVAVAVLAGCAPTGRLSYVSQTVAPMKADSTVHGGGERSSGRVALGPMFGTR